MMLPKILSSLALLLSVSAASAGMAPLSSLPSTGKVPESEAAEAAQKFVGEIRAKLPIRQAAYEITDLSFNKRSKDILLKVNVVKSTASQQEKEEAKKVFTDSVMVAWAVGIFKQSFCTVDDPLASSWRGLVNSGVTVRYHLYADSNYLIDGDISKGMTCYTK